MHPLSQALEQLNARGFITVMPQLAAQLGFKPSIFLGHALYWTRHLARTEPGRRGWFYLTARQCEIATSLTAREQKAIREDLVRRGLMEEVRTGQPAKMHYRVSLDRVRRLLGPVEGLAEHGAVHDRLTSLLQIGLRFYKPLADIAGSVAAGLYLSYLLEQQRRKVRTGPRNHDAPAFGSKVAAIFPPTQVTLVDTDEARSQLGLGSKVLRNAREHLEAAGLISERRAVLGQVPTVLNLKALLACLNAQAESGLPVAVKRPARPKEATINSGRAAEPTADIGLKAVPQSCPITSADQPKTEESPFAQMVGWKVYATPRASTASQGDKHSSTPSRVAPAQEHGGQHRPGEVPDAVTRLLVGMFAAPVHAARPADRTAEAAAPQQATSSSAEFAEMSKLKCRNVETDPPFCRNTQGITREFSTTTTAPVDNSRGTTRRGRRRGEDVALEAQHAQQRRQAASLGTGSGAQPKAQPSEQSSLVLPHSLAPDWHAAVLEQVALAPVDVRQTVLDELAGQLSVPSKQIHNPAGWMRGLVQRVHKGAATFAFASKVKAEREQRARLERSLEEVASRPPAQSVRAGEAAAAQPPSEQALARIEQLKALRNQVRMRVAGLSNAQPEDGSSNGDAFGDRPHQREVAE